MRHYLVAGVPRNRERVDHVVKRVAPVDKLVDAVAQGLDPDLYSGHAQLQHEVDVRFFAIVRLCLHREPDAAVVRSFVDGDRPLKAL